MPKYLSDLCDAVRKLASFSYCVDLVSHTSYKTEMVKALVNQSYENDMLAEGWDVNNLDELEISKLFLEEGMKPKWLTVFWPLNEPIPKEELKSAFRTFVKTFDGELELLLPYSHTVYDPIDDVILCLKGAR